MPRPTIRDVAQHADVSVATVSRVINGTAPVREETRLKVQAAIEELGFQPNTAARQLSGGKTHTIGILSPLFTRPAFVERLAGIQDILDRSEYDLVLYGVRSLKQLEQRILTLLNQKRVDGLIMLSVSRHAQKILEERPDFPVLIIDEERVDFYPTIVVDNFEGGRLATTYLVEKGHQRLGFVGDEADSSFNFISSQRRFTGFQAVIEEHHLPTNGAWYRFGAHSRHIAYQDAKHILSLLNRPTAIVAASDTQAFGVVSAARDLGLKVPEDVAVIGFDDIEAADIMQLTTVRARVFESGQMAAQMMLDWVATGRLNGHPWRTVLPMEVVVRATT